MTTPRGASWPRRGDGLAGDPGGDAMVAGASAGARASGTTWARAARRFLGEAWIHALLLAGVGICAFPLVWMFLTSVKTDDEVAQDSMVPAIPEFRASSPYVPEPPAVTAPVDVDAATFAAALPSLRELTTSLAAAALPAERPPLVDARAWASSAGAFLLNRALEQMPRRRWAEGADAVAEECRALLPPDVVRAAVADRLSRVELSTLVLRTLDGRTFDLAERRGAPAAWRVESGAASLAPDGPALRVDYHFDSGGDAPVVLIDDFELPDGVEPADLHKIVVGLRGDESWHGVAAALELGGTRWESARTTYLAQNREQSLSLQPPTFDDTTMRPRTWVPLRAAGASDRARHARLTLRLVPSSRLGAIAAKGARNYLRAFDSGPFLRYVGNSVLLVVLTVAGAIFSSAFVAYAFARLQWPGRAVAMLLLLSTMMVPPQVTMVPSFLVWRSLGWYNTLNPIWVPAWLGNGFFIFLMVQHMKTIPRELEEAARIDGLNVVQTWWYVIVPQLKPTLAAIAVLSFLGAWNAFMAPLIYLRDQAKFPLSLGLLGMRIDHTTDWALLMAANVMMTVPTVAVFLRFQRYFVEGITVTGMKG
jgi:multiple sugar transport system permease protein